MEILDKLEVITRELMDELGFLPSPENTGINDKWVHFYNGDIGIQNGNLTDELAQHITLLVLKRELELKKDLQIFFCGKNGLATKRYQEILRKIEEKLKKEEL